MKGMEFSNEAITYSSQSKADLISFASISQEITSEKNLMITS